MFKQQLGIIHTNPLFPPSLSRPSVFEALQRLDFPCSIQKCDARGGMRGGGAWGGGVVVRFKWIALCLLVPSPKHYNASASDLHLSGAPYTGGEQGTLLDNWGGGVKRLLPPGSHALCRSSYVGNVEKCRAGCDGNETCEMLCFASSFGRRGTTKQRAAA